MVAAREAMLAPLTEPIFCPEVFATGFVVQRISTACVKLIFFSECPEERQTVAKIIRPVPLLIAGNHVRAGVDLGTRKTFADLCQTLADIFGVGKLKHGTSFLKEIAA